MTIRAPRFAEQWRPPGQASESLADLAPRRLREAGQRHAGERPWYGPGGLARPEQYPPEGDWLAWIILAGRGWGKTRVGAELCASWARGHAGAHIALVAETFGDGRDVMVEGVGSGLLACIPERQLYKGSRDRSWNRSLGELRLANGSRFSIYSAEDPNQLRGPQHHYAWGDEAAKWKDARLGPRDDTTWSNLMMGLRLGESPRVIVTTTPKPVRLLKGEPGRPGILTMPGAVVTRGRTIDNLPNLSPAFRQTVITLYEGTRLGRQELDAEMLEDVEGALWTHEILDACRVREAPNLQRVVVAVDPAVTSTGDSDETGIVVAGVARCECKGKSELHGFVVEDLSGRYSPDAWARRAIDAFDRHQADRIVAEVNNGGDLVEANLRTIRQNVSLKKVHASKGKVTRAEPISAIYEQGRIHHLGSFARLEDQMTSWVPGERSPDRMDALVWALSELMLRSRGLEWT